MDFTSTEIFYVMLIVIMGGFFFLVVRKLIVDNRILKESISRERADAVKQSRSTLKGKIGEQMSPLFPEFYSKYEPADARFIGSPIDYIIFKNMGKFSKDKKELIEVIFLDIKTGSSTLSPLQNAIKSAVKFGRIDFQVLPLRIEQQRNFENKPSF